MAGPKKAQKKATADAPLTKDITEVTQVGLKARDLANKYSAQITPRIGPNLLPALENDLTSLGVIVPAAKGAKDGSIQATADQTSELEKGFNLLTAIRSSVARARPGRSVTLAYGVGIKVSKLVVKDVTTGLQKISKRVTAQPQEALGFGITANDLVIVNGQIKAIADADKAQEAARAAVPQTTKQRNATARSILGAVDRIAAAGTIEFANSATERALFESLIKKAK